MSGHFCYNIVMSSESQKNTVVDRTITNGQLDRAMPSILGYIYRNKIPFGGGNLPPTPDFFKLPDLVQTYIMEYAQGCGVPSHSIDNNGLAFMLYRSGETNSFFGVIKSRAKKLNSKLYYEMSRPKKRLKTEPRPENILDTKSVPIITHERYATPRESKDYIFPTQTIFGYSGSRVLIEIMGRSGSRTDEMMLVAMNVLDKVLKDKKVKSYASFIAVLANEAIHNGAHPIAVLSHILVNGILKEQGCVQDYRHLALEIRKHSPRLWAVFVSLDSKTRGHNGIIDLADIHLENLDKDYIFKKPADS